MQRQIWASLTREERKLCSATFQIGVTVAADGFDGSKVWAADVNGDGDMDLIVESGETVCHSGCDGTQHLSVYLARSGGAFGNQQIFAEGSFNRSEIMAHFRIASTAPPHVE